MASKVKTLNKEIKRCWVDDFQDKAYNFIKEEDKIPVLIISYKRPKMVISNIIYKSFDWENKHWPIYVVVRISQEEDYKKEVGDRIKVIGVEDELINSCGKVREWCITNSNKVFNSDTIIMMDDDITVFDRSYLVSLEKENGTINEYARHIDRDDYSICDAIAMWQLAFQHAEKLNDRVVCSSVGSTAMDFTGDIMKIENSIKWFGKLFWSFWLVNCKKAREYDLHVLDNKICGHEDLDFYCQVVNKGLFTVGFNWLTRAAEPPSVDFIEGFAKTVEERYRKENELNLNRCKDPNVGNYLKEVVDNKNGITLVNFSIDRTKVKNRYKELGVNPIDPKAEINFEAIFNSKSVDKISFEKLESKQLSLFDM